LPVGSVGYDPLVGTGRADSERSEMDSTDTPTTGEKPLEDSDLETVVGSGTVLQGGDADGTDGDSTDTTDADGTDGDSTDTTDADGTDTTDADGTDGDATDG
jgi:hypothetical protein